jgi:uncharacterized protein YbjT (DUF2867 family)
MERLQKKAIVLGATGLVGHLLTEKLLEDAGYSQVLVFSRKPFGVRHAKLTETRTDLLSLEDVKDAFMGDVVFCCVGTTETKTPDLAQYKAIDYGIPVAAARLCEENGISNYLVVSALGANPKSRFFYNRIKGEMEVDVLKCQIPNIHLLQPSLIGGLRNEKRKGERFAQLVMGFLKPLLLGPLAKYKMIDPNDIAAAMIFLADHPGDTPRVPSDQIHQLAGQEKANPSHKAQQ